MSNKRGGPPEHILAKTNGGKFTGGFNKKGGVNSPKGGNVRPPRKPAT